MNAVFAHSSHVSGCADGVRGIAATAPAPHMRAVGRSVQNAEKRRDCEAFDGAQSNCFEDTDAARDSILNDVDFVLKGVMNYSCNSLGSALAYALWISALPLFPLRLFGRSSDRAGTSARA